MKTTQEERKQLVKIAEFYSNFRKANQDTTWKKVQDLLGDFAELEAELDSARKMMEDCTGDDAFERVNLWLDENPTREHPDVRNAPAGKDYDEYMKEVTK